METQIKRNCNCKKAINVEGSHNTVTFCSQENIKWHFVKASGMKIKKCKIFVYRNIKSKILFVWPRDLKWFISVLKIWFNLLRVCQIHQHSSTRDERHRHPTWCQVSMSSTFYSKLLHFLVPKVQNDTPD